MDYDDEGNWMPDIVTHQENREPADDDCNLDPTVQYCRFCNKVENEEDISSDDIDMIIIALNRDILRNRIFHGASSTDLEILIKKLRALKASGSRLVVIPF